MLLSRISFAAFSLVVGLSVSLLALEPNQSEYLALSPGDHWIMIVVLTDPSGRIERSVLNRKNETEVEKNGKTYVPVKSWVEGGPDLIPFTKLYRKDAKGLYSIVGDEMEQLEIPLPMQPGSTWKREEEKVVLTEIVIGIETVTIGEQTYEKCVHIQSKADNGSYREDFWEAPKVGRVKSENVKSNGVKITSTLQAYKPAK